MEQTLPAGTPLGQPYWLREEHTVGMFKVDARHADRPPREPAGVPGRAPSSRSATRPWRSPTCPCRPRSRAQPARRLDVIAPVALRFLSDVRLFAPGSERPVDVEVTAARDGAAGTLDLEAPAGWTVTPASQPFRLASAGDRARLDVHRQGPVRSRLRPRITAEAHVGDRTWNTGRVVIRHEHIPVQLLQPPRG